MDNGTTNFSKSDLMLTFKEKCDLVGCEHRLWTERDKSLEGTSYVCSNCTCQDDCYQKANCCPSKILQDIQKQNSRLTKFSLLCSATELIKNERKPRPHRAYGYWMVGTCPTGYPESAIHNNCIDNLSLSADISVHNPVTSFATNVTYKNIYCALCHGEDRSEVLRWKMEVKIDVNQLDHFPYVGQPDEEIFKGFADNNSNFDLVFEPPVSVKEFTHACFIDPFSCEIAGVFNNTPQYRTCQDRNYFSIFTDCNEPFNEDYFHCAICNKEYVINESLWCPVTTNKSSNFSKQISVQFARQTDQHVEYSYSQKCAPGEIYEPKKRSCLDVACGKGFVRVGPKCQLAMIDKADEATYVLNALGCDLVGRFGNDSAPDIYRGSGYVCQVCEEELAINVLAKKYRICTPFSVWLRVSRPHRVVIMLEHLYDVHRKFNSVPDTIERIHIAIHPNSTIIFNLPKFTNPVATIFLPLPKCAVCSTSPSLTFSLAKWQVCPKVFIESYKIYLRHDDFSFCFKDYDACVSHLYVTLSDNIEGFEVCVDQYLKVIKNNYVRVSAEMKSEYILIGCLIISLFTNSISITSIFFLTKEWTPILLSELSLAATFFTLNFLHILIRLVHIGEQTCAIFGIFIHFFLLFAVSWCMIVCVDLALSIQSTIRHGVRGKMKVNRFAIYALLSVTICLPFIACNILLNDENGIFLGYSPFSCDISSTTMSLYTLGLPLGFCLVVDVSSMVYILYKIKGIVNLENCPEISTVKSLCGIMFIVFLSWGSDILLVLYKTEIFASLNKISTALIGILIFFSFSPIFTDEQI